MTYKATQFSLFFWLIIAVFGMLYLPTWTEQLNNHAVVRHGEDAVQAAQCLDGSGTPAGTLTNQRDYDPARVAHLCFDPSTGRWFILFATILGAVVTAYCVEKAKRKGDMLNYCKHRGFK